MNVSMEVTGTPPRQPDPRTDTGPRRGVLLVCNHRSYLDVPSVGSQMSTYMVGAAFAKSWPVLGPAGSLVGILFSVVAPSPGP